MARDEVIRELCDERIVSNFDTIVNLNTSVYSVQIYSNEKEPGFFFFLTRLLTDSLIKLSGQKKKEKTRVLFRRAMHALILSTFRNQIRNLIYKSYHFRLHAGHLLLYFPSYRPLTISQTLQSFFSKDSLF